MRGSHKAKGDAQAAVVAEGQRDGTTISANVANGQDTISAAALKPEYVNFLTASKTLEARRGATPQELAVWVSLGRTKGVEERAVRASENRARQKAELQAERDARAAKEQEILAGVKAKYGIEIGTLQQPSQGQGSNDESGKKIEERHLGGGIDGFRDAPAFNDPQHHTFTFPPYERNGIESYLTDLNRCYFLRSDLDAFTPRARYLNFAQVVERWKDRHGLSEADVVRLLQAHAESGGLENHHPVTGGVDNGVNVWVQDKEAIPREEAGIFPKAQIEAIELELPQESAEAATDAQGHSKPVTARKIENAFHIPNVSDSDEWWSRRMGNADRYGLSESRARKGHGKTPSLWYPDRIAGWLSDKEHLTRTAAANILRRHFPQCGDAADLLDPPKAG